MQEIISAQNPRFQHVKQLVEKSSVRRTHQETILEGVHLIERALLQQVPLKQFWVGKTGLADPEIQNLLQQVSSSKIYFVPDHLFSKISAVVNGPQIIAVMDIPSTPVEPIGQSSAVILDRLQDAGNAGTILRTAAAAGIKNIISLPNTVDLWSPKVLRAGMGAHFVLNINEQKEWRTLSQQPLPCYATSSHANQNLYELDLTKPHIWIFGNEGQGVAEEILKTTTPVNIPQPGGEESLNVASAAAICLFEAVRQLQSTQ